MILMKTNFINQKNYIKIFTTSILKCLKKNQIFTKYFTYFKYFNFIFQNTINFKFNSNTCNSFLRNDYNNLTFKFHVNKS